MEVPRSKDERTHKRESASLYQTLEDVSIFYQQQLKNTPIAIHYLKQRGVSGEIAKKYELGFAPDGWNTLEIKFIRQQKQLMDSGMLVVKDTGQTYDRYRQRITFPIRDRNGRIIGFGGRAITIEQKPKYLNSPETAIFQKNRELYGLHQIIQQTIQMDYIIVVEGYMDVIMLAQNGVSNAVASLGTATSAYHIQLLARFCKRIIFCFDGDEAGRKAAWRALEHALPQMNNAMDALFAFLPEGQDPDSFVRQFGKEAFLQFLQSATPLDLYFFQCLSQNMDLSTTAGKSQLISAALPYLASLNDGPFKVLLIDALSKYTRISEYKIEQMTQEKTPSSNPSTFSQKSIQRTPLQIAMALLIQHPNLAALCVDTIDLEWLDDDDKHQALIELLHFIKQHPQCTTAHILEKWRQSNLHDSFHKLASWNLLISEDSLKAELCDTLKFIQLQSIEKKIETCKSLLSDIDMSGTQQITNRDNLLKLIHLKARMKQRNPTTSSTDS